MKNIRFNLTGYATGGLRLLSCQLLCLLLLAGCGGQTGGQPQISGKTIQVDANKV